MHSTSSLAKVSYFVTFLVCAVLSSVVWQKALPLTSFSGTHVLQSLLPH